MSRIAAALPVDARMYRHFAAITLAVTALVALFADGENRQAIADEVEARETRRELREQQAERPGFSRDLAAHRARPSAAGWDSGCSLADGDTAGSYVPDDMAVAEPLSDPGALPPGPTGRAAPMPPVLPPGIPRDDYAFAPPAAASGGPAPAPRRRLTPEEQRRLLQALGDSDTVAGD